jgi:hypothetical protein
MMIPVVPLDASVLSEVRLTISESGTIRRLYDV